MKDRRWNRRKTLLSMAIVAVATPPCDAFPSSHVSAAEKQWQLVQSQGVEAFECNEFGKAERLLKEAVAEARTFPRGDIRFAQSPGELGRLLTVRGRFSEAEPYLEEELHLKRWAVADENVSGKLIPDMGALVRFYLVYGTAKKADPLTMDILFFVEGKLREETEEREEAAKRARGGPLIGWAGQAVPVMRDPLLEWAITCDDIGNLYAERGRTDLADRLFKAALDVKSTVLGKQHLSLANSYDSLGKICMQKKEYPEAESYFRQALEITEKIQPADNPQVFNRLDKLGKCLISEGKLSDAEQLYQQYVKSLHGQATVSGIEPRALYVLGCAYCEEKKFSEAAPVLSQALHLSEQFNGTSSVQITPYLREYAYAMYYLGRRGEADHLRARADFIAPIVRAIAPAAKLEAGVWTESPKVSDKKTGKTPEKSKAAIASEKTTAKGSSPEPQKLSEQRSPTESKKNDSFAKDVASGEPSSVKNASAESSKPFVKSPSALSPEMSAADSSTETRKASAKKSSAEAPKSSSTDSSVSLDRRPAIDPLAVPPTPSAADPLATPPNASATTPPAAMSNASATDASVASPKSSSTDSSASAPEVSATDAPPEQPPAKQPSSADSMMPSAVESSGEPANLPPTNSPLDSSKPSAKQGSANSSQTFDKESN